MPSLHPTVPTQLTTPRMPTSAAQAIPTTPSRNTTIRRHNISRKCIHCKVPHIGGPLHCKVNKMRIRPFTTTTASTQTGNYTCSTCVLPPTSPNTTLPAPFDFTDTPDPASPLPAPSNCTYSSVGPLSLRQNLVKLCGVHNIPVNGDCMVKLVARPWSLNGRSMVARLLWPPALSHRPSVAIYLGARPFWAPDHFGRPPKMVGRDCSRQPTYLNQLPPPFQNRSRFK